MLQPSVYLDLLFQQPKAVDSKQGRVKHSFILYSTNSLKDSLSVLNQKTFWKWSRHSFHLELMSDGMLGLVTSAGAREAIYPHRWHVTTQQRFWAEQHVRAGREACYNVRCLCQPPTKTPDGWKE